MADPSSYLVGDCRELLASLPSGYARICVTSPPYWGLRDYGAHGQIGIESYWMDYVSNLVGVFREVRRVLAKDGMLWLNLGDCHAGSWGGQGRAGKSTCFGGRSVLMQRQVACARQMSLSRSGTGMAQKSLMLLPSRVAIALADDGWTVRSDIVWHKVNGVPESVMDRPTKCWEHVFLLAKSRRYYYDAVAIARENGTNARDVWPLALMA